MRSRVPIDQHVADGGELTQAQQRVLDISETMIPNLSEDRLKLGYLFARSQK